MVDAARDALEAREFVPFRSAFAAGARLAMSGHGAVPAVSGRDDLPATLSRAVMTDLLRRDLGFEGVTISDALDMGALAQGPAQVLDVLAAGQPDPWQDRHRETLMASPRPELGKIITRRRLWQVRAPVLATFSPGDAYDRDSTDLGSNRPPHLP